MWLTLLVVFSHVSACDYPFLPIDLKKLAPHGIQDMSVSDYFLIDPSRKLYYLIMTPDTSIFLRVDFEVYNSELELRLKEDDHDASDEVMTRHRG